MKEFEVINDQKMHKQCMNKIIDLTAGDRLELFEFLISRHPNIMKTIIKY